jgi:hypothetical protein
VGLAILLTLTLGLLVAPVAASAQPVKKTYRIGVLDVVAASANAANLAALRKGLAELGYVDGQSFVLAKRDQPTSPSSSRPGWSL